MNLQERLMQKFLSNFKNMSADIMFESGEELHLGEGKAKCKITIHEPIPYKKLLQSTSLALGEAYMDGKIDIDGDIRGALDDLLQYQGDFKTNYGALKKLLYTSTSKKNQKDEVCSHYDIGNDFYELWLDPTLSYSCAYFENGDETLEEAQYKKIHHILKKLCLEEGMTLLDIGCGWGYLLIEAAKKYKIKGLGITLSEEQYKGFNERIKKEGLEDLLEVKLLDYRDLHTIDRKFDRVVSVGMLEHVGRDHYDLFFKNVNAVLKDKGGFLLHYISALGEYPGDAWIKKYIFPGGVIPSLREIISIAANYKYYVQDVESLRRHYTKTLLCWYDNFEKNLPAIKEKFDDRFIRMWTIYLCACAAVFNNGITDLHQIQFVKGVNNDLPMTRKYMYED